MESRRPEKISGFTLVEILVVIVILSVISGIAVVSIGNQGSRKLSKDAEKLAAILNVAANDALYESKEIGFVLTEEKNGYNFYYLDETDFKWKLIEDDERLKERNFEAEYLIELVIEGKKIDFDKLYKSKKEETREFGEKKIKPDLVFLSDGQYVPFYINVSSKENKKIVYKIKGDGFSPISMEVADE